MGTMRKLFIPRKSAKKAKESVTYDDYGTDMRAIERWANALPPGGYASLTGPGETTTPGRLDQEGGLFIDDSAGDGIDFFTTAGIDLLADEEILIEGLPPYGTIAISTTVGFFINAGTSGPGFRLCTANNLAGLPPPPSDPSWALTNDGHIYYTPGLVAWALKV